MIKAKIQEADLQLADIKKDEYEFERDILKGSGKDSRPNPEKVAKYLEDKLHAKVK